MNYGMHIVELQNEVSRNVKIAKAKRKGSAAARVRAEKVQQQIADVRNWLQRNQMSLSTGLLAHGDPLLETYPRFTA